MSEDMGLLRASPVRQDTLPDAWRPISSAEKNNAPILAAFRSDIYPVLCPAREDLKRWNGIQAVLQHQGVADDGFDIGWNFAAPVGSGGFPDAWIAGWKPLPDPPTRNDTASAAANQETLNPQQLQTIDRGRVEP